MKEEVKGLKTVPVVQIEANEGVFLTALPPYMSPERWALLIDKTERAVKKDLQTGVIARYQPAGRGGLVMVNVIKEMKKAEQAADY